MVVELLQDLHHHHLGVRVLQELLHRLQLEAHLREVLQPVLVHQLSQLNRYVKLLLLRQQEVHQLLNQHLKVLQQHQ